MSSSSDRISVLSLEFTHLPENDRVSFLTLLSSRPDFETLYLQAYQCLFRTQPTNLASNIESAFDFYIQLPNTTSIESLRSFSSLLLLQFRHLAQSNFEEFKTTLHHCINRLFLDPSSLPCALFFSQASPLGLFKSIERPVSSLSSHRLFDLLKPSADFPYNVWQHLSWSFGPFLQSLLPTLSSRDQIVLFGIAQAFKVQQENPEYRSLFHSFFESIDPSIPLPQPPLEQEPSNDLEHTCMLRLFLILRIAMGIAPQESFDLLKFPPGSSIPADLSQFILNGLIHYTYYLESISDSQEISPDHVRTLTTFLSLLPQAHISTNWSEVYLTPQSTTRIPLNSSLHLKTEYLYTTLMDALDLHPSIPIPLDLILKGHPDHLDQHLLSILSLCLKYPQCISSFQSFLSTSNAPLAQSYQSQSHNPEFSFESFFAQHFLNRSPRNLLSSQDLTRWPVFYAAEHHAYILEPSSPWVPLTIQWIHQYTAHLDSDRAPIAPLLNMIFSNPPLIDSLFDVQGPPSFSYFLTSLLESSSDPLLFTSFWGYLSDIYQFPSQSRTPQNVTLFLTRFIHQSPESFKSHLAVLESSDSLISQELLDHSRALFEHITFSSELPEALISSPSHRRL